MTLAAEILGSLGGAAAILYAFSHFLGKVWAERIAKQTVHGFEKELEALRSANLIALEQSRSIGQQLLEERESFNNISQKTYQDFFEMRISTYKKLLAERHKYIIEYDEDFVVDEVERWGDGYVSHYNSIKEIVGASQLYLSAKLEEAFEALQEKYNSKFKTNEREIAFFHGESHQGERESELNNELLFETSEHYAEFVRQLKEDVKSLRSRIDLDKV